MVNIFERMRLFLLDAGISSSERDAKRRQVQTKPHQIAGPACAAGEIWDPAYHQIGKRRGFPMALRDEDAFAGLQIPAGANSLTGKTKRTLQTMGGCLKHVPEIRMVVSCCVAAARFVMRMV